MKRVYNFSAGPSMLPEPVLRQAAAEMLDYRGTGMSVMEMSHRSPVFEEIMEAVESKLRQLMGIPDSHAVLFLQGGASLQFSMVPLNLMPHGGKACYVETGLWSHKAIEEAKKLGTVVVTATSADQNFNYIPALQICDFPPEAAYVHITTNNTIYGTRYDQIPATEGIPLVADMSSDFLARTVDVSRFGIIYAGAQKNAGPAGLTLVIIRRNLLGRADEKMPALLDYKTHAQAGSLYNTPPCFAIYMAGLVFDWLLAKGGLAEAERRSRAKAALFYDYLDRSRLFRATVRPPHRSWTNIPFLAADETLYPTFLVQAERAGLVNLKGHRSVGGMRASLYNAMPQEGVERLISFMQAFERGHA